MYASIFPNIFGFLLAISASICIAGMLSIYPPVRSIVNMFHTDSILFITACLILSRCHFKWLEFFYIESKKEMSIETHLYFQATKECIPNMIPGTIVALYLFKLQSNFIMLFLITTLIVGLLRIAIHFMERKIWIKRWNLKIEEQKN